MKNIFKIASILLGIVLLFVTIITAAQGALTGDNSATLGGSTQEREKTVQTTITIINTDNTTTITGITASFSRTITGYSDSDFNVTFTGVPSSISPNNSSTITISGYVPDDFDAGRRAIGTVTIGSASVSKTLTLNMETENNLEIDDVDLEINDKNKNVDDGDTFDVERGDSITLTIKIENTHKDIDIEDVEVTVESDGDTDADEQEDIGDLRDGDDDTVEFSFDVPDDADDGRETFTITVEGVDENGARHFSELEFDLDIQVERYDLTIKSINMVPSNPCPGDNVRLEIEVENTGLKDISDGVLYIEIEDLDYTKRVSDIELDSEDDDTSTISLSIPDDARPGSYFVDVEAFYKDSSSADTDFETDFFTIEDCEDKGTGTPTGYPPAGGQKPSKNETDFEVVTTPPTTGQVVGVPVTKKASFLDSNGYLVLLIITNLVVLALIITILTQRSKKEDY